MAPSGWASPYSEAYVLRFSRTVSRSQSPGDSVRKPIRARSVPAVARVSDTPSMTTLPLVGAISPASIRIVVVFPAPLGPRRATISDFDTSNDTSATTARAPNRRVRCCAVIMGRAGWAR
jgi:hypothetical protein